LEGENDMVYKELSSIDKYFQKDDKKLDNGKNEG